MKRILTGDRPTGPLHIGHYIGSLKQRVELQHLYEQFVLIADLQGFTDHVENPSKLRENIVEVIADYYAVGIDFNQSHICIQSMIPQIAELAILYLNLVTVNRLRRNPTVKTEIIQKGYGEHVTAGFLMYPVHQAADMTIVGAELVPVGADQLPMIEQANEIIDTFNRLYRKVFERIEAYIPKVGGRVPGIDGNAKMGKSLGNAIYLSDSPDQVQKKVMSMYTDPGHLHVQDPGKVEGNVVFTYLDIFDPHSDEVAELKLQYQKGGLGDVVLKRRLNDVLQAFLDPIRHRRQEALDNRDQLFKKVLEKTAYARSIAEETMEKVRNAIGFIY